MFSIFSKSLAESVYFYPLKAIFIDAYDMLQHLHIHKALEHTVRGIVHALGYVCVTVCTWKIKKHIHLCHYWYILLENFWLCTT